MKSPDLVTQNSLRPARRLVVNADDFGRSQSINQAVIRAHREGILTSASLMVNEPRAAEAAALRFEFLVHGCRVSEEREADTCRVRYRIDGQPEVILTKTDSVPLGAPALGKHGFSVGLTRDSKLIPGTFTLVQTAFEVTDTQR